MTQGLDLSTTRSRAIGIAVLLALLALLFQGSRGLWEPDEGRYTSIALQMLRSGDWFLPTLNGEPFLDKPPLLFWSVASGLALGGQNEWAARLPLALVFLAHAAALAGLGRALWDRTAGLLAALIWGTSLLPFLASNLVTPDLALSCCSAFTWLGVVQAARAQTVRERWYYWLLAGLAAGLGLLAKGPALLINLPPLMLYLAGTRRLSATLRGPQIWLAASLALGLAAAWYVPLILSVPDSASYLLDNQVTGRLISSSYERNAGFVGAFATYVPTLVLGALPWWPIAAAPLFGSAARRSASWHRVLARRREPVVWLLCAGVFVPLAVFMAASSRLPLYLLPIWTPLALGFSRLLKDRLMVETRPGKMLLTWCLFLLALKVTAAYVPVGARDSRRLAGAIAQDHPAGSTPTIVISAQANGLPFYGFTDFHWVREGKVPYPLFAPPQLLEEALPAIAREGRRHLVLMDARRSAELLRRLEDAGWQCAAPSGYERLTGAECAPPAIPEAALSID